METNSGTLTVWQSGRLAPRPATRSFEVGREQWLLAGLLVLSAIVFTMYVMVLVRDVDSGELQHAAQRSRAVAEAQCEADQPALLRGRCIALLNGDVVALDAAPSTTPDNTALDAGYAQENAARATTLSLLAAR
jgi:hypothetical protein